MDDISTLPASSWPRQLRTRMQARPRTAIGLFIALAAVLLLFQSLVMLATEEISSGMRYGLIGGAAGFAATALGALPALLLRAVPQRVSPRPIATAIKLTLPSA